MFCYRCEHRARFLESLNKKTPYRPRYECGEINQSKGSCYMFMPCLPIISTSDIGDERPRFGPPLISRREIAKRVMNEDELKLKAVFQDEEEIALGWEFK